MVPYPYQMVTTLTYGDLNVRETLSPSAGSGVHGLFRLDTLSTDQRKKFPAPIKMSENIVAWPESELIKYMEDRNTATITLSPVPPNKEGKK